jgi:hypothetical protein
MASGGATNDDEKTHNDVLEVGEDYDSPLLKGIKLKSAGDDVPLR